MSSRARRHTSPNSAAADSFHERVSRSKRQISSIAPQSVLPPVTQKPAAPIASTCELRRSGEATSTFAKSGGKSHGPSAGSCHTSPTTYVMALAAALDLDPWLAPHLDLEELEQVRLLTDLERHE